jgi:hypothetical protein
MSPFAAHGAPYGAGVMQMESDLSTVLMFKQ